MLNMGFPQKNPISVKVASIVLEVFLEHTVVILLKFKNLELLH